MNLIFAAGNRSLPLTNTCAAIGIFDGVHRGHEFLLKKMLAVAKRLKAKPIVITFFPHPAHVLRPGIALGYVSPLSERLALLAKAGVDTCVIIRFNKIFACIPPEKFIRDMLVKKWGVRAIFVGDDFRFGRDRAGDVSLFKELAMSLGYEFHPVPALMQGQQPISSTRIRQAIVAGQISEAARLLGRPVVISGKVVTGSRRGKSLGYPTANVAFEAGVMLPHGVYVVRVRMLKKTYPAVANIGIRPSFKEKDPKLCLEVHLLDFDKDIYGCWIDVEFLKMLRPERIFKTPQDLIKQIQHDAKRARHYFK